MLGSGADTEVRIILGIFLWVVSLLANYMAAICKLQITLELPPEETSRGSRSGSSKGSKGGSKKVARDGKTDKIVSVCQGLSSIVCVMMATTYCVQRRTSIVVVSVD